MPIDDNFAAVGKLDLQHTTMLQLKIQIGATGFQCGLNTRQRDICQAVEFLVIHAVLPSRPLLTGPSLMSRILAITLALSLAACGFKGPLEMPSGPVPEPLLGNHKPAQAAPAAKINLDVSTDKKALPQ